MPELELAAPETKPEEPSRLSRIVRAGVDTLDFGFAIFAKRVESLRNPVGQDLAGKSTSSSSGSGSTPASAPSATSAATSASTTEAVARLLGQD